jgi:hypothetical protein
MRASLQSWRRLGLERITADNAERYRATPAAEGLRAQPAEGRVCARSLHHDRALPYLQRLQLLRSAAGGSRF